jgi:hypothetical protein
MKHVQDAVNVALEPFSRMVLLSPKAMAEAVSAAIMAGIRAYDEGAPLEASADTLDVGEYTGSGNLSVDPALPSTQGGSDDLVETA